MVIKNANLFKLKPESIIIILAGNKIGRLVRKDDKYYIRINGEILSIKESDYIQVLDTGEIYSLMDIPDLHHVDWIQLLDDNIKAQVIDIKHERYLVMEDNSIVRVGIELNKCKDIIVVRNGSMAPKDLRSRLKEYKETKRLNLIIK